MQPAPAEFLCDQNTPRSGFTSAAQTTSSLKLPVRFVMGLSPPHSVINVGDDKHEWLALLHLIATHRPAHLQHEYTTILIPSWGRHAKRGPSNGLLVDGFVREKPDLKKKKSISGGA